MKLLSDKVLNTIRGKALVGKASSKEIASVFGHLDALEVFLDQQEQSDCFGTEGWKHAANHPDAD